MSKKIRLKRLPNYDFNNRRVPEVGSKIKSARRECGLSQIELAKMIGFKSGTALSLLENNLRRTDAIVLWQIAQITNCPITYFL